MQGVATIGERLGIIRPHGKRVVVACQRLLVPSQLMQGETTVVVRLGKVRPYGKRTVIARQRLLEPLQLMERQPRLNSASAESGRTLSARS